MNRLMIPALLLSAAAVTGCSQMNGLWGGHKTASAADESGFAREAASDGMTEVRLGRLAEERASSPEVKRFAQRMVSDHTAADDRLRTAAEQSEIPLPISPDSQDQAKIDRLATLRGAAFDRAYMDQMVADHRQDVTKFQSEVESPANTRIEQFAQSTLPTLREHLDMAEKVDRDVGGSG